MTTQKPKKVSLSEAELHALRDCAQEEVLTAAQGRLRWYHPERSGELTPDEVRANEHDRMVAASEVYGATSSADLMFERHTQPPRTVVEAVDVEFTPKGLDWMARLRDELVRSLEDSRGSIEINETSAGLTFLVFVINGICEGGEG